MNEIKTDVDNDRNWRIGNPPVARCCSTAFDNYPAPISGAKDLGLRPLLEPNETEATVVSERFYHLGWV